jgi:putative membrane protein
MDYMFSPGFLGTKAPFFMDFVTLIVTLLPFLVVVAIYFAKRGKLKLHVVSQLFLYILSVIVVSYFEYGVRIGGGFETFAKESSLSKTFLFEFLLLHIVISVVTVFWWTKTIISGMKAYRAETLPGKTSVSHRKAGLQSTVGIFLTSLTGLWVYLFLFVY